MGENVSAQDHYANLYNNFRWSVPPRFNLAEACCARHARAARKARRAALVCHADDGSRVQLSYAQLHAEVERCAAALVGQGVRPGDRVAIVMPQRVETAVAYLAVWRIGAIALPLSMLFGPDALEYRLVDAGAKLAIADESSLANLQAVRGRCPALGPIVAVGAAQGRADLDWDAWLGAAGRRAAPACDTAADDPALIIYTSGTTGPPKGALIAQRGLIGNLPGFVCSQNWMPLPGDVFWSPADWAWTGGLMDALLPTLYFGGTIVGWRGRFKPELAFELMQRERVTNTFLFPTALKQMMKAYPDPRAQFDLRLRAVMSAGEAVGDAVFAYGREALGVTINEMFGQTEINYIVGNCGLFVDRQGRAHPGWPARAGSMGRAYPGHRVAVVDDAGRPLPPGEPGDVAVHRRDIHGDLDPVFFLGYWNQPEATRRKFTGDPLDSWCRTGDVALADADGYLWYQGRSDDVFKVSGYRVGPSEIENCLVKHPAVANAAVVPRPDAERGAVVQAYVVLQADAAARLADDAAARTALVADLQAHVRTQLAPYEVPKHVVFVDALPMTTTGKVQRHLLRSRAAADAMKS